MRTFRVIRIDATNGEARQLYAFRREGQAWMKAEELERAEVERPFRRAWFAATDAADYQAMAREFFKYRKQFAMP